MCTYAQSFLAPLDVMAWILKKSSMASLLPRVASYASVNSLYVKSLYLGGFVSSSTITDAGPILQSTLGLTSDATDILALAELVTTRCSTLARSPLVNLHLEPKVDNEGVVYRFNTDPAPPYLGL